MIKTDLQRSTQVVAYFLWEYTNHDTALDLWYCAEDMAFYAERFDMIRDGVLYDLISAGKYDYGYMEFVRNVAYRIFVYTLCGNDKTNWFIAERLVYNEEWLKELANMSHIYRLIRQNKLDPSIIRSDRIRSYYKNEQAKRI